MGTLIYIGSAITLVFGIESETWGNANLGAELQERLKVMVIVAHAALLGKMVLMSKTSSNGSALKSPPAAADEAVENAIESKKSD